MNSGLNKFCKVSIVTEVMNNMLTGKVAAAKTLKIFNQHFPSKFESLVKKFNLDVMPIIRITDINFKKHIMLTAAGVGWGDSFKTMEKLQTLDDPSKPFNLEYKKGEIWLINFWATSSL